MDGIIGNQFFIQGLCSGYSELGGNVNIIEIGLGSCLARLVSSFCTSLMCFRIKLLIEEKCSTSSFVCDFGRTSYKEKISFQLAVKKAKAVDYLVVNAEFLGVVIL